MLVLPPRLPLAPIGAAPLLKVERHARRLPEEPSGGAASLLDPVRRRKIWELSETLHCSIIGTCLSTAELRSVLVKLGAAGASEGTEHDVHVWGVSLSGHREAGAKLLQKALDRRHAVAIKQFVKAKDETALNALWADAAGRGDIPGAYWALLTHPAATPEVIKKAFQDVHMLSHLVGAANRADIRRLRQLEEENDALLAKIERQQKQIRDGFMERDRAIARLNETLAQQLRGPDAPGPAHDPDHDGAIRLVVQELEKRLSAEIARRERLEKRCQALSASLNEKEREIGELRQERDAHRRELEALEEQLGAAGEISHRRVDPIDLGGLTILYVGGRPHQLPQLRSLAQQWNAALLDHDGGVDHNPSLLPNLIGRADVVLFPVDCISHGAAATVKRLCRRADRPFRPLRSSGLTSLAANLRDFRKPPLSPV